jgi:hypothetical protein
VESLVIDAEMMGDFMQDSPADLLLELMFVQT